MTVLFINSSFSSFSDGWSAKIHVSLILLCLPPPQLSTLIYLLPFMPFDFPALCLDLHCLALQCPCWLLLSLSHCWQVCLAWRFLMPFSWNCMQSFWSFRKPSQGFGNKASLGCSHLMKGWGEHALPTVSGGKSQWRSTEDSGMQVAGAMKVQAD